MAPFRIAYLVCSTQRSGSTYLCQLLASTETLGRPQEFFEARAETGLPPHPGYFLAGLPRTGAGIREDERPVDGPDYSDLTTVNGWEAHLERTFALGTTPNGVFGAKIMWNQLADLEQHAAAIERFAGLSRVELLEELFDGDVAVRFVWMRRRDKVRQAISLWRALQTRTWRLEHPGADRRRDRADYGFEGIEHLRRRLSADDDAWGRFFDQSGSRRSSWSTRRTSSRLRPSRSAAWPPPSVPRCRHNGRRRLGPSASLTGSATIGTRRIIGTPAARFVT